METDYIREPVRETPILESCDVAVVGGGIAGIAAALSASREGASVLLLEQQFVLGGLATIGLVTYYLPLCDGAGQQVSFGIAEELLQLSAGAEGKNVVDQWKKNRAARPFPRLEYSYNPNVMALEAEKLLLKEGVRIRYGVQVCAAVTENGRIKALILETRSGRCAVSVRNVIDASGDGVIVRLSGEKTAVSGQQNILASWYAATENGSYQLHPLGACDIPEKYKMENSLNKDMPRYTGTDYKELSEFTLRSHRAMWEDFLNQGPVSGTHQFAAIPAIPQVRMTRKLAGKLELDEPDTYVRFEDSIGMIGNWKRRGPVYEIPLSCLYGCTVINLITAGRCISVTDTMWDNTRVIPACAVTGEAAGTAAAITDDFPSVDPAKIQEKLLLRGIPLHPEQLPEVS